ncbi:MAG: hypothetical protein KU37_02310 [Sulfuricurvum sp. PC08-66]|nr:MAG: hypothetical protein KU37_02310 [Sulfuricurvum sp. PC08-66]
MIRNQKFHLWIHANAQLLESLRQEHEAVTGNSIDFDTYVEFFYHQSKRLDTALPTRTELKYMLWQAQNRTLLNQASTTMIVPPLDAQKVQLFTYEMYQKTQQGTLPLSDFIA